MNTPEHLHTSRACCHHFHLAMASLPAAGLTGPLDGRRIRIGLEGCGRPGESETMCGAKGGFSHAMLSVSLVVLALTPTLTPTPTLMQARRTSET